MTQTSQESLEDHSERKRHKNAGRWMNPEHGYAKTNPKRKLLNDGVRGDASVRGRGRGRDLVPFHAWRSYWK
jgi:hypothetical protein